MNIYVIPGLDPKDKQGKKKRKLGKGRLNSVGFLTNTFHARAVALNEVILLGALHGKTVCSLAPALCLNLVHSWGPERETLFLKSNTRDVTLPYYY